jgi:hypothetical protein
VAAEHADGAVDLVLAGMRALGEAAPHQVGDALADEAVDLLQAACRAGKLGEHEVGGVGEVGDGVEQGAVEVEEHRARREACVHPHAFTAASSARSAPRMES